MTAINKALATIQREIHAVGVGKTRKNKEQGFNFRGIDDALMAFAPLLTTSNVVVIPSYSGLTQSARATKNGGTTYNATVAGTFTFLSTEDASSVVVGPFYGEANDGQDKAVSKATSIAYRNALFVTFCVPHEPAIGGDPDQYGEPEDDGDAADWLAAITDAATVEELEKIGGELKAQAATIPAPAMKRIRSAWAARAKEVKV